MVILILVHSKAVLLWQLDWLSCCACSINESLLAKVSAAIYAYIFNQIFELTDDYSCNCMGVKRCETIISSGDGSRISSKLNSKISDTFSTSVTRVTAEFVSHLMGAIRLRTFCEFYSRKSMKLSVLLYSSRFCVHVTLIHPRQSCRKFILTCEICSQCLISYGSAREGYQPQLTIVTSFISCVTLCGAKLSLSF
jgi:hypothetical protein